MTHTHVTAPTQFLECKGNRLAYRRLGPTQGVPLVFLQHFTGTMDSWDPAVVDGFARDRPVVLFDNTGVGGSSGETPATVREMALDAAAFMDALGLQQVDLLGFSLGGFVAQVAGADHPERVRRLILVGTGPEGGEGIKDLGAVLAQGQQASPTEPRLYLFFDHTEGSQRAGRAFIDRQARRALDRDANANHHAVAAQLAAIVQWAGTPTPEAATRARHTTQPALVVNGKSDVMVPTINSYSLFQQLPNARLTLYPDSGHGALFQYADAFVTEGLQFLAA
jgi:pimeloyl-ACP methyl ester carboxylesterase